jgi:hypothetical protein
MRGRRSSPAKAVFRRGQEAGWPAIATGGPFTQEEGEELQGDVDGEGKGVRRHTHRRKATE